MAPSCEFNRLFNKSVPHILEKIFLSLDFESFVNCLEVSKSWNDILRSESFQRMGKYIFGDDLLKALVQAAIKGTTDRVRIILKSGLVEVKSLNKIHLLHGAARNGHKDVVHLLLDSGVEQDKYTKYGETPLHLAAFYGHIDVVQFLLDRGTEPDIPSKHGETPLHFAAVEGHTNVVQLLLERGAEPNKVDATGRTPLATALWLDHKDIATLLSDKRATCNLF